MRNSELEERVLTRAKNAAYRYLTYRPRSRAELQKKLKDKGFHDTVIREVLSDLIRLGYINDEKFAGEWARSRVRSRSFGRRRIERELNDKGIEREIVRQALSDIFTADIEFETAKKAALRKFPTLRALDRETQRRRLAGFLERKGFSYEVIRTILKEIDKGASSESE